MEQPLPKGWAEVTKGGKTYYWNRITNETTYTRPSAGGSASAASGQGAVAGSSPARQGAAKPAQSTPKMDRTVSQAGMSRQDKQKAKVDSLELARPKAEMEVRRATSKPAQPLPPTVVKIMPTAITLSWANQESEEKLRYNLEQASKAEEENMWCIVNCAINQVDNGEAWIAEITGLKVEEKVSLRLIAINSLGESQPSRAIKVKTIDFPKSVTDVAISEETSTSCKITWKAPNNVPREFLEKKLIDYTILARHSNGAYPDVSEKTVECEHVMRNLRPAESYDLFVTPTTAQGDGPTSKMLRFMTKTGVPGVPEAPIVNLETANEIGISMNPVEGVSWKVEHDNASGGKEWVEPEGYQVLSEPSLGAMVCTIKGLSPGYEYRVRVSAFNKYGSSKPSKPAVALTMGAPNAPESVTCNEKEITATSAPISWTWTRAHRPIGEDSENPERTWFSVYYVTAKNKKDKVLVGTTDTTEIVAKDLPPNENITFYVHGCNRIGEGPACAKPITIKTPPGRVEPPSNIQVVQVFTDGFSFAWVAPPPLPHMTKEEAEQPMSFIIEGAETDEKSRKKKDYTFAELARATECAGSVRGLKPGMIYALRFVAVSAYGPGYASKVMLIPTIGAPSTPQNVEVSEPTATSVRLSWVPSTVFGLPEYQEADATDPVVYVVEVSEDKKTWKEIGRTEEDTLVVKGLTADKDNQLRVKAVNKQGESGTTKPITVRTRAGIPNCPEALAFAAVGSNTIDVSWAPPKPAAGVSVDEQGELTYSVDVEEIDPEVARGVKKAPAQPIWKTSYQATGTSFTISDLKFGTVYAVRVCAANAYGAGLPSKAIVACTVGVPLVPGDFRATAATVTSVALAWTAPRVVGRKEPVEEDPVKYVIQVTDQKNETQLVEAGTDNKFVLQNLQSNRKYALRLCGKNNQGTGPATEAIEVRTRSGAPSAPEGVSAHSAAATSFELSWEQPGPLPNIPEAEQDKASKYAAEVAVQAEVDKWMAELEKEKKKKKPDPTFRLPADLWKRIAESRETKVSCTGLQPGIPYYARVIGGNKFGWGHPCRPVTIQTLGVPSTPGNIRVQDSAICSATISWSASTTAGSVFASQAAADQLVITYVLETSQDAGKTWAEITKVDGETAKITLPADSTSLVRVKATNAQGASQPSDCVQIRTAAGVPKAPLGVAIVKTTGKSAAIVWQEPVSVETEEEGVKITNYMVEVVEEGKKKSAWTLAGEPTECAFVVSELKPATSYLVRVSALNSFGRGETSTPLSFQTVGIPSSVSNVQVVEATATTVKLSWRHARVPGLVEADPEDPVVYIVEVLNEKTWTEAGRSTEEEIVLTGLSAAATCSLRVVASNKQGNGVPSKVVSAKTKVGVPNAPKDLAVTGVGSDKASITWAEPDSVGEDPLTYNIELGELDLQSKKKESYNWRSLAECSETSYSIEELESGMHYAVRVSATNVHGEGQPSKHVSFITIGSPDMPVDCVIAEANPDAITIKWSPSTQVAGVNQGIPFIGYVPEEDPIKYVVETSQDNTRWEEGVVVVNDVSGTVGGLKPGQTYYFRVRAFNNQGSSVACKALCQNMPTGLPRGAQYFYVGGASPNSVAIVWAEVKNEWHFPQANSVGTSSGPVIDKWLQQVEISTGENQWAAVNAAAKKLDTPPSWATDNVPKKELFDLVWFGTLCTGLKNNTKYMFRVMVSNTYGSVSSKAVAGATASGLPPAPVLQAVVARKPASVVIAFAAGEASYRMDKTAEVGYKVEVRTMNETAWRQAVLDENAVQTVGEGQYQVTVPGLSASMLHYIRACAMNKYGSSEPSEAIEVETASGTPSTPANIGLEEKTDSMIRLGWNPGPITAEQDPSVACGYVLEYANQRTSDKWERVVLDVQEGKGEHKCAAAVSDLQPGGVYNIRLAASNIFGESPMSEMFVIRLFGPPPRPNAPSIEVVQADSCVVSWRSFGTEVKGVTYRVEVDDGLLSAKSWRVAVNANSVAKRDVKGKKGADDMEGTITGLLPCRAYRIRIVAANRWGTSEPSGAEFFYTEWDKPQVITTSARFMYLKWTKDTISGGNANYRVEYNAVDDNKVMVLPPDKDKAAAGNYTRVLTMLLPNTNYAMRVMNAAGQTSKDASFTTTPIQQLPPTALTIEKAKDTSLKLSWKQPSEPVSDEGEYVFGDDCLGDDVNDYIVQHDNGTNGIVWIDIPKKGAAAQPVPGKECVVMGEVDELEIKNAKKNITGSCMITGIHPNAEFQVRVISVSARYGNGPASSPVTRVPPSAGKGKATSMYNLD